MDYRTLIVRKMGILAGGLAIFAPLGVVHAQARTLTTIIQTFIDLIEYAIPIVMVLGVLAFTFQAALFIWGSDSDKTRAEGKWFLLWGVIGLFVMICVWGIVLVIEDTFFA